MVNGTAAAQDDECVVNEHGAQPSETFEDHGHLSDDAVVIRGGMMKPADMRTNAEAYEAKFPGTFGLTFWSWEGLSAQEIATRVGTSRLPHPVMRQCTAGKIRSCVASDGQTFSLTKTGSDGHYTLALPPPAVR